MGRRERNRLVGQVDGSTLLETSMTFRILFSSREWIKLTGLQTWKEDTKE
jgi:hypothetical protein